MTSLSEVNGCKTKARAGAHLAVDLVPTDGEEHETDDLKCNLSGKVEAEKLERKRTIIKLPERLSMSSTLQNKVQQLETLQR